MEVTRISVALYTLCSILATIDTSGICNCGRAIWTCEHLCSRFVTQFSSFIYPYIMDEFECVVRVTHLLLLFFFFFSVCLLACSFWGKPLVLQLHHPKDLCSAIISTICVLYSMRWYSLWNLQQNQLNWNTRLQKYKEGKAFARLHKQYAQHIDNDANAYMPNTRITIK